MSIGYKGWSTIPSCNSCKKLQAKLKAKNEEIEKLKKWQIKPTEAICITLLSCRHKKVFRND